MEFGFYALPAYADDDENKKCDERQQQQPGTDDQPDDLACSTFIRYINHLPTRHSLVS